jgi:hypothetical protein
LTRSNGLDVGGRGGDYGRQGWNLEMTGSREMSQVGIKGVGFRREGVLEVSLKPKKGLTE